MSITLDLKQSLPFDYTVTLTDNNSLPIDLTGADIVMKIRPELSSDDVTVELSVTNGRITFVDAVNGRFRLYIEPAVTVTVEGGVFDIVVTTAGSDVYLLAEGGRIRSKQIASR